MSWGLRLLILIGGVFAAVVLFFAFRDDGDNGTEAQPRTPSPGSTTSTSTAQEPAPQVFRINTRVPGIKRISLKKDRRAIIIVVGDSTEEVHLHGYDMKALMTPERPAGFSFRADEAGRFEIEFEDSGDQIAELTVTP